MLLKDKRILVTGSSRGIGLSIAQEAAAEGATVVVHGRTKSEELDSAITKVRARNGDSISLAADLVDPEQIANLFQEIDVKLGGIDVLVNNAAMQNPSPILDLALSDWDQVMAVNLRAPFLCAQEAGRRMLAGGRGGKIINISSVHGKQPRRRHGHYSTSKGGLEQLTRCLALELGEFNIQVNALVVGAVATELTPQARQDAIESAIPMGRVGVPEEIARLTVFLASDACSYITGSCITIDGGLTLGFSASRKDL